MTTLTGFKPRVRLYFSYLGDCSWWEWQGHGVWRLDYDDIPMDWDDFKLNYGVPFVGY